MVPLEVVLESRMMFERRYSPSPNSMDPLTPVFRMGLIPVTICAMLSMVSVTLLLCFITNRLISWRKHYKEYVGYNQYVILIYNLLIADLQQSLAFAMSFHWLRLDKIIAPTAPCFIQAWFLNLGDVASGFFVLAIAIHTWLGVVRGYKMPYKWFVISILMIWAFALFLTVLGPAMHGDRFFARAGGWCWISVDFEKERLYLHYLWVFIVEFGTMGIYGHVFFHLRDRIQSIINNDTSKLARATKFMVMYPAVYVILTLPIAVGRMATMTGLVLPETFFCVAGSLLTSCGWIDALLYTLTRRILVSNDLSTGGHPYSQNVTALTTNPARPGDEQNYGLQSINKEVGQARTVTIVGGSNRISRLVDANNRSEANRLGRSRSSAHAKAHSEALRQTSLAGSEDSIIRPGLGVIGVITETNIRVEMTRESGSGSDHLPSRLDSRNHSYERLHTLPSS